jgi:hypothetical protein
LRSSLFEWAFPTQKHHLQSRFHEAIDHRGIQDTLGASARLCHRNTESRTSVAKRISGRGEPDPERADQGSAAAFRRRKGGTGRDRSPPGSNGAGGRGGNGQARYDSGLVSKAHRKQIGWVEMASKYRAPKSRSGSRTPGLADGEGKSQLGLRSDRRCLGKSRPSSIGSDNVLRRHGISPASKRKQSISWKNFIRAHRDVLVGMDFFTTEVLTLIICRQ